MKKGRSRAHPSDVASRDPDEENTVAAPTAIMAQVWCRHIL